MTQLNLSNDLHLFRFSKRSFALAAVCALLVGLSSVQAQQTWDAQVSNVWSNATNWSGNALPTTVTAVFATNSFTNAGSTNVQLGANQTALAMLITATNDFSISGAQTLTLTAAAITNTATTGTTTINSTIDYNGANVINNVNATLIFAGGIVNGKRLDKSGTGTVVLGASNVLTGLNLTAGAVRLGNGGALGASGGNNDILSGSAVEFTGGITVNEAFRRTGGSGINGAGALRNISGTNTVTGLVTLTNAVTIGSDSGEFVFNAATSATANTAFLGAFGLTFVGAGNNTVSGIIGSTVTTVTKEGAGTLTLSGVNTYTGATTLNAGTLRATTSASALGAGTLSLGGGLLELANDTGLNFARNTTVTADTQIFSERLTAGAAVTNTLGTLSIGAQTLTVGTDASVTSGTAGLTFGAATLTGAATFSVNSGAVLNFSSTMGGNFLKTFSGAGNSSVAGVVSGTTGLTKTGTGTLTLGNAANTYGGVTTIGGGVLSVGTLAAAGANSSIGTNGTVIITNGGVLDYTGATTTNARGINLAAGNGGIGVSNSATALTISGVISNSGTLVKSGSGTLILSASNNYTGGTVINAGALAAGNVNAFGTNQITINAGLLNLSNFSVANTLINNGGTLTNVGTVTGAQFSGGTTTLGASSNTVASVSGTATVDLSGASTTITNVTGGTVNVAATSTNTTLQTVSGGTINASTNITVQTYNGGNISNSTAVTINSGNSSGSISGAGNLIKLGSGTLQLSGSNSYTGTTFISNGVVAINTNAALAGTTLINLNNGTALAYSGGTAAINRNISVTNGTAAIQNTGGGTLTLSGTLSKNGTVLVFSNGTFNVTGVISGASANSDLVVDNATVTLSNANTYVGPTFIRNAGNLTAAVVGAMPTNTRSALIMDDSGSGSSIFNVTASQQIASLTGAASSSATIATNTSLTIGTNATNSTFAGVISGGGVLVKDGSSTQTLSGANTYSGGTLISSGVLAGSSTSLQGNITNNASVVFDQSTNGTYSGVLSGNGSLLKTNSGTLILDAANTQSGGTLIGAGALQIGNGSTTGSLAGLITNNSSLIYNRSDNLTQSTAISGSGSVTKNGAGTVTLSGANSYSGTTTISNGAVRVSNANGLGATNGGTTVIAGAALEVNGGIAIGAEALTLNSSGISSSGALRSISGSNTYGGLISLGTGVAVGVDADSLTLTGGVTNGAGSSFTKVGAGTLILDSSSTATGILTVSGGTMQLGSNGAIGVVAMNVTNGSTFDLNGRNATLGAAGNLNVYLSGATIKSGAGTLFLNGSGVTVNSAADANSSTISGNLNLGGATNTFNVADGAAAQDLVVSAAISNGGIIKTNTGALVLSASNSYSGDTTLGAGTLLLGNTNALSASTLNNSAGTLSFGSLTGANLGGLQGANGLALTNASGAAVALNVGGNNSSTTYSGALSGTGSLTKNGTGTLTLSGGNTYSGGTLVSGGALVGNNSSLQGNITNDTLLVFDQAADGIYAGVLSGSGALIKTNAGTLTLTAANTQSGTTIGQGALQIGNGGSTGSLSGPITNNSSLIFNLSDVALTQSGVISGNGALTKLGAGTVTLSAGNNTYGGTTTIAGGVLAVGTLANAGSASSIGTNSVIVLTNDGVLRYTGASVATDRNINLAGSGVIGISNATTALTISGVISNTGALRKFGSGTLILSGANTYSGGTEINTGTLQVGNSGTTGSIGGPITNNSRLIYNRSDNLTQSTAISGTGSLTKNGGGTLTLSGGNSYSGGTFVSAGALAGSASSLQGNITNDASVIFDQSTNGTYAGVLSGTGSLLKTNAGTLILTAANTQSGGTLIGAGTLQIGNGGTTGSLAGAITNNSSLIYNRSDNLTQSTAISGTGSLTKNGGGTLTLSGGNSYSGGTLVSAGALAGDTASLQGNITNNTSVIFDQSTDGAYAGVLSGSGSLTKRGVGALTLTAANTQSGTTIAQGSLQIGNGGTTGSISGPITNNASLIFNRSDNLTQSSSISGSGSLTKNGAGTVTLTAANTFSGATTVSAGILNLNNAGGGSLGSTASVSVANGATLLLSQSAQVNDLATVSLSGGTIRAVAGISEKFSDLTVTSASFLDFGATFGNGTTMNFGNYTPSALLTINNFDFGSKLTFTSDLTSSINNTSLFSFSNGGIASYEFTNGVFTITAIPEPSTYLAAAGLLGLMLWPSRRRIIAAVKSGLGLPVSS